MPDDAVQRAAAHLVVQHVHEVGVERVHVVDLGEVVQNLGQLVVPVLLRELHLAHIKLADALDGPACGFEGWDQGRGGGCCIHQQGMQGGTRILQATLQQAGGQA
jgi:hypothetical protein